VALAAWLPCLPCLRRAANLRKRDTQKMKLLQFFIYFVIVTICFNCSRSLYLSGTVSDFGCVAVLPCCLLPSSHLKHFFCRHMVKRLAKHAIDVTSIYCRCCDVIICRLPSLCSADIHYSTSSWSMTLFAVKINKICVE
jgi:hypothetical protein